MPSEGVVWMDGGEAEERRRSVAQSLASVGVLSQGCRW